MFCRVLLLLTTLTVPIKIVVTENKEKFNIENSEAKYNFNHPPSVDDNNPIPVAIVYDNDSEIIGQSGTSKENKESDSSISIKAIDHETNDKNSTSQLAETSTISVQSTKKSFISKLNPKSRALSELQIPVSVVYEEDADIAKTTTKTKTNAATEAPKKGRNLRRLTENKAKPVNSIKQIIHKEQVTPQTETEKPTVNSITRTFPKRIKGRDPIVPILESENFVYSHTGNFHYRYEGGDGTMAYSEGSLKKVNEGAGAAVKGGYSYTDDDGNDFSVTYTADENGYRPVGAHLPTPPPIPPAIARALAYLATATPEPVTKSSPKLDLAT